MTHGITDKEWGGTQAAELKAFLARHPNMIQLLRANTPKISKERKIEERAMSGSEAKGASDILDLIEDMAKGFAVKQTKGGFID